MWTPAGKWNARQILERGCKEDVIKWAYYAMETGTRYIKNNRDGRNQANIILDLENLTYYVACHMECKNSVIKFLPLKLKLYKKLTPVCLYPALKTLFSIFKTLESCYPEILKNLIIVNGTIQLNGWCFLTLINYLCNLVIYWSLYTAPWVFNVPFNFVKGVMNGNTLKKFRIFGSNKEEWMSYLLELAPKESLPEEYFQDENRN